MGQFVGCIKGISEASLALDFPIVSGNVSPLQRDQRPRRSCRRPTIGGVGLLEDVTKAVGIGLRHDGDVLILVGATAGWLGRSTYLKEIVGSEEGAPPPVDLAAGEALRPAPSSAS